MEINSAFFETLQLYGLKEIAGQEDNPEIMDLYASVGHSWVPHDEVAWCAALHGAKLLKHGYRIPELKKRLTARAYISCGEIVEAPVFGRDYVVLWRGSEDDGIYGHVAWPLSYKGNYIKCLGGNQNNKIGINLYHKRKILNFLTPIKI